MNALHFACALLLTLLLLTTLFASSAKVFFTEEELAEMGIHFGSTHIEEEGTPA